MNTTQLIQQTTHTSELVPVKEIQQAYASPKVHQLNGSELARIVQPLITYVHQYRNEVVQNLGIQVQEVIKDLRQTFKNIGSVEISLAFQKGVRGEFLKEGDKIFKLSPAVYREWLSAYVRLEVRNQAIKELIDRDKQPKPEPTPEEKDQIHAKALENCIAHLKRTGEIFDPGNAIFNELVRRGEIKLTADEQKAFESAAREIYEAEISERADKAKVRDFVEFKTIVRELDQIEGPIAKGRIISIAKRLALREYLILKEINQ